MNIVFLGTKNAISFVGNADRLLETLWYMHQKSHIFDNIDQCSMFSSVSVLTGWFSFVGNGFRSEDRNALIFVEILNRKKYPDDYGRFVC